MLGNTFGWPHLLIILAIVLLLFGAPKLPALAKSVGQSMRVFRGEMKNMKHESGDDDADSADKGVDTAKNTEAAASEKPDSASKQ